MEFNKLMDVLCNCWFVKSVISCFVTAFTFLIGDINGAFAALWMLVFMDLMTKWAAISKRTLDEENVDGSIFYGFYLGWHTGRLNSNEMRRKFATKLFAYLMLIIVGNLIIKIIPSITIFGADWSKFPGGFIYSFLAVTEMMSIVENLIEMGMDALKPLAMFVGKKRNEMTK